MGALRKSDYIYKRKRRIAQRRSSAKKNYKKKKPQVFLLQGTRISWRIIITAGLVALTALYAVSTVALDFNARGRIAELENELSELIAQNAIMEAEITPRFTQEELEYLARERLNMSRPDNSRIAEIRPSRQSFVTRGGQEPLREDAPLRTFPFWSR